MQLIAKALPTVIRALLAAWLVFLPLVYGPAKAPPIGVLHSPVATNVEPTMQPEPAARP